MKHYIFKDIETENKKEGVVINLLNDIGAERKEEKDMVVKFYDEAEGTCLFRFRNFDEVELTEISNKEYNKLK